ncbi:hypothetical protein L198_01571 [Cryptococcus wingfieldii CBS 7118]|uniref:Major facilitator superfamily (MFS) profile domain-containing protein n=1 Tax=Cryptococcus wingfieldii CBS 7118 TaxID=1295528 RepID=A0A1E3JZV6_9TREE|nr:hypothetical protein L198_01571 [Cryptococcus wingfieldii CBS 7118]ODO06339.1 hypothetical protein L198_01571 [Cryptococcus wingfieldii CBS 7118]
MSSSSPSISLDKSAPDQQRTAQERTPESVTRPIPVERKSTNSQHAPSQDLKDHEPPPYSAFSKPTKYLIVGLGAIAAIFSPISSNIFVPAIPTLADQFHRSESDISQAITIYLVFQAITPSIFGAMSDSFGRRPLYLATLVIYLCANIGLALTPTSTYALLLVLRALQLTGGSAVIAIGYGCVADVAEPRERGTYAALFQSGALLGPALGPLIGGILTQTLGWRSIFWFLVIATGVILVPLTLILPETLRSLVGNGSIPPPKLNSSPMELYRNSKVSKKQAADGIQVEQVERPPRKPAIPTTLLLHATIRPRNHLDLLLDVFATIYAQDISPGKGGAVSASYNLVRCAFGAIGTATIQKMYKTLGAGWTFVLLTGLVAVFLPFPIAVIRNGKEWREARLQREESKKQSVEN